MRIRAAVATVLIGLTVASCTSGGESPAAVIGSIGTTTSPPPTTTTSKVKCADFAVSTFIGLPATRGADVTALGWFPSYVNADISAINASVDSALATIVGVEKKEFGCQAIFTVKVAPPEPPKPAGITEGTYLVGTDMEPGSYKTTGGDGCYWARLKDDSGRNIIANDFSDGPMRFTVKKGEYLQISGPCLFTKA
jgi:hypothetical protein